jgi:hypothetical protein
MTVIGAAASKDHRTATTQGLAGSSAAMTRKWRRDDVMVAIGEREQQELVQPGKTD